MSRHRSGWAAPRSRVQQSAQRRPFGRAGTRLPHRRVEDPHRLRSAHLPHHHARVPAPQPEPGNQTHSEPGRHPSGGVVLACTANEGLNPAAAQASSWASRQGPGHSLPTHAIRQLRQFEQPPPREAMPPGQHDPVRIVEQTVPAVCPRDRFRRPAPRGRDPPAPPSRRAADPPHRSASAPPVRRALTPQPRDGGSDQRGPGRGEAPHPRAAPSAPPADPRGRSPPRRPAGRWRPRTRSAAAPPRWAAPRRPTRSRSSVPACFSSAPSARRCGRRVPQIRRGRRHRPAADHSPQHLHTPHIKHEAHLNSACKTLHLFSTQNPRTVGRMPSPQSGLFVPLSAWPPWRSSGAPASSGSRWPWITACPRPPHRHALRPGHGGLCSWPAGRTSASPAPSHSGSM